MTANKSVTGWKTDRLVHHQTEGRCTVYQRQLPGFILQEALNVGMVDPPLDGTQLILKIIY